VIFNYLIGNADAHAKNISILYQANGTPRLAPAYDLLATGYWPELATRMAMAIGGEKRPAWVHARHWRRFCESVGLNPPQLRRRALDLCAKALAQKDEIAAELPMTERLTSAVSRTLERNSELIHARLVVAE
jgi:serine/threonine-protein kinase HipA